MLIKVLIADDHVLVRAGLCALLQNIPDVQIVGEASNGSEALKLIEQYQPNIAIMDIAMPELNGLEAAARITNEFPHVRVLVLSMHATEEYARRAIRAGVAGYVLKDSDAIEFKLAIQAIAAGNTYLSPAIAKHITADYVRFMDNKKDSLERLPSRLREVLQLIAEGNPRQTIADKLSISPKTFDAYRAELMEQLDIHDVAGLVRYAIQKGLVNLNQ
jgi:DNA-binding NarL/FixJ family response regulator